MNLSTKHSEQKSSLCLGSVGPFYMAAIYFPKNCSSAAKMTLWLCPVILYGYKNAAKSKPAKIA